MEKENLSAIMDELFATTDVPTIENNPDFYDEEESGIVDYNPDEADEYADEDYEEEPETYAFYGTQYFTDLRDAYDTLSRIIDRLDNHNYEEDEYDSIKCWIDDVCSDINSLEEHADSYYD